MIWVIEGSVRDGQKDEPDSGTGPCDNLFVPEAVKVHVLQWVHKSKLTCYHGANHMLIFAQRHFWWPNMYRDIKESVSACPKITCNKSGNQLPAGFLLLPIPSCLWSHITVNFTTFLPLYAGTVYLFSKAAHFVTLPKLPSTLETTQLMVQHAWKLLVLIADYVA